MSANPSKNLAKKVSKFQVKYAISFNCLRMLAPLAIPTRIKYINDRLSYSTHTSISAPI